jgi:hypothetical protein
MALWLICLVLPINGYTMEQSVEAYFVLFGFVGAFVGGTLIWRKRPLVKSLPVEGITGSRRAFTILLIVAAVGLALRFYDLLAVKNFASYASASEFRNASLEEGPHAPGILSALSIALFPVALVTFVLSLYLHRSLAPWQRLAAWGCVLAFGGYSVIQGGRSLVLSAAIMIAAVVLLRGLVDPTKRIESGRLLAFGVGLLLAACAFIGYSAQVLQSRLESMGVSDPMPYLDIIERDRGFYIQEPFRSMLASDNAAISQSVMTVSWITYYVNHGFFDFSELYESERGRQPSGGVLQFAPLIRVLNGFGVDTPSVDETAKRFPKEGLFYTFFGSVLIDYGVIGGLVYCFMLGAFVQLLWIKARAGSLFSMLLYPFFVSVILHLPIADMVSGANGVFIIFATCLSYCLVRLMGSKSRAKSPHEMVLRTA